MTDLQPTKKRNEIVNAVTGAVVLIGMVAGLFFLSEGSSEIVPQIDMNDSLLAEQGQIVSAPEVATQTPFIDAASVIVEAPMPTETNTEERIEPVLFDFSFMLLGAGLILTIALIGGLLAMARRSSTTGAKAVGAGDNSRHRESTTGNKSAKKQNHEISKVTAAEADVIDAMFTKHGISASVKRAFITYSDTGNFVRYPITGDARVNQIKSMSPDLSVALSDLRNKDTIVKVREPRLVIELAYPLQPRPLIWADAPLDELQPFHALWGIDYSQDPPTLAKIDYGKKTTSNDLISGAVGSGKTSAAITKMLSLAYSTPVDKACFIVLDYKQDVDLAYLRDLPHVTMFHELEDCIAAIHSVQAEYVRRKGKPYTTQVFLIVDELAELLGAIQDKEAKEALLTSLGSIARAGRSSGVRLTLITQKSLVDIVGSEIKGNLPHRLAGKVTTREESKIATGLDDIGCELLPGAGSYYYVDNGVASRIQGFYLPDEQRMSVIAGIAAKNEGIKPYRIPMIDSVATQSDYDFEEEGAEPFDNKGFDSTPSVPVEPEPTKDPVAELVAKYGVTVVEAWITERDGNGGKISGAKIAEISKAIRGAGIDGTNSAKIRDILCAVSV